MLGYSRGTDDTARQAPTGERRDAATSCSNAAAPSASQFSASAREGDRSCRVSASIGTGEKSILCTSTERPALEICFDTRRRALGGRASNVFKDARTTSTNVERTFRKNGLLQCLSIEHLVAIDDRLIASRRQQAEGTRWVAAGLAEPATATVSNAPDTKPRPSNAAAS
jgi:hypothetical protein